MAQQLRTLAALPEVHMMTQPSVTPFPGEPVLVLASAGTGHAFCIQTYMQANTIGIKE